MRDRINTAPADPIKTEDDEVDVDGVPSFKWNDATTTLLLKTKTDFQKEFESGVHYKRDLWNEIAKQIAVVAKCCLSGEMCNLKYRNLLQTYRNNRRREINGRQFNESWKYYDHFRNFEHNESIGGINAVDADGNVGEATICVTAKTKSTIKKMKKTINSQAKEVHSALKKSTKKKQSDASPLKRRPPSLRVTKKRRRFSFSEETPISENTVSMSPEKLTNVKSPTIEENVINFSAKTSVDVTQGPSEKELNECRVYGESIGLQLAYVKDVTKRTYILMKIQELIYLANDGKLVIKHDSI